MKWYCEKCKTLHSDDELCPRIKDVIKKNPKIISEVADFTTVAAENVLIKSQLLDNVAQGVNKLAGTNLSYEGTERFARDIQVFKRLNEEPFSRCGAFSSTENAKKYFENVLEISKEKPRALAAFEGKLTGYSQEVDWIRMKHGQVSSIFQKSTLLENNAPGVDGETINRFTGKQISRTTIKASYKPMTSNSTGINDVKEAISKNTATEKDIIFGPKGTKEAAQKAGLKNPVIEKNTPGQIQESNKRLEDKILNGEASNVVTPEQVGKKMVQGAIVGAAVGVTISAITNYVRYKNGGLTRDEAFVNVGEDTIKGTLVGAAMGAVNIFLPGGAIGFIGGMAIGIYFNKTCTNILDEIFGKGAYGAILNASGYVYGMTFNLAEYYKKINNNEKIISNNINASNEIQMEIERYDDIFEKMKGEK